MRGLREKQRVEQSTGSGQEPLSVLPTRAECQCLVPSAHSPELPAARGLVDVTRDPAELKMGWQTSVASGTPSPPGE
jgi:hypothetical protein